MNTSFKALRFVRTTVLAIALVILSFSSDSLLAATPSKEDEGSAKMCAAVRGNGARIYVHFGSLAKFHETYGMLWGISGGSSGSVVSYFVESMYANPLLTDCGNGQQCSKDETAARAALLMKTFASEPDALKDFPDSAAFFLPIKVAKEITQRRVSELLVKDSAAGVKQFTEILETPGIAEYVNPEVKSAMAQAPNLPLMVEDLATGILNASEYKLESYRSVFRPGVTSFAALSESLGRVGTFYAGQGAGIDRDTMQQFFQFCATPGRGKEWGEVSRMPVANSTCGEVFKSQLKNYYGTALTTSPKMPNRVDQKIGGLQSLRVLASVTQIGDSSAKMWKAAHADYLQQRPINWNPNFTDWSVAYAGREDVLDLMLRNVNGYQDFKTSRARKFKDMSWREMISRSPAEPGTSRALEMAGGTVTTGGWADGQPVLALKNIGCDEVVLFDTVPNMSYQARVAELLGATKRDQDALFAFDQPNSSFALSVRGADGVWCVDWNNPYLNTTYAMAAEGWNGVFEVRSQRLATLAKGKLAMITPPQKSVCTVPFR